MKTILDRLRMAGRLAWCSLAHGMERSRGGWRCLKCEPVKHHNQTQSITDLVAGANAFMDKQIRLKQEERQ